MSTIQLPRFLKWRDGRPRFELGGRNRAELVKAGFESLDLKDPATGQWLGLEASIRQADLLNARIDRWRAGEAIDPPAEAGAIAPDISTRVMPGTIAAMIAGYERSTAYLSKKPTSRRIYKVYGRTLTKWIGPLQPVAFRRKQAKELFECLLDVAHWREERRAAGDGRANDRWHDDFLLMSRPLREAVRDRRIDAMEEADGQPVGYAGAYCTLAHAHLVWQWAIDNDDLEIVNPCSSMKLQTPAGRIREISEAELNHLDKTSIEMGLPEAGEAWRLAVLTTQRRIDLARLGWDIRRTGRLQLVQEKTGKIVDVRATRAEMELIEAIWTRQSEAGRLRADRILVASADGKPFETRLNWLTTICRRVREKAAETMPSCADIILHDGRDTGITRLFRARLSLAEIAARTGHSLADLQVIQKGYLNLDQSLADGGTDQLDRLAAKNAAGRTSDH